MKHLGTCNDPLCPQCGPYIYLKPQYMPLSPGPNQWRLASDASMLTEPLDFKLARKLQDIHGQSEEQPEIACFIKAISDHWTLELPNYCWKLDSHHWQNDCCTVCRTKREPAILSDRENSWKGWIYRIHGEPANMLGTQVLPSCIVPAPLSRRCPLPKKPRCVSSVFCERVGYCLRAD